MKLGFSRLCSVCAVSVRCPPQSLAGSLRVPAADPSCRCVCAVAAAVVAIVAGVSAPRPSVRPSVCVRCRYAFRRQAAVRRRHSAPRGVDAARMVHHQRPHAAGKSMRHALRWALCVGTGLTSTCRGRAAGTLGLCTPGTGKATRPSSSPSSLKCLTMGACVVGMRAAGTAATARTAYVHRAMRLCVSVCVCVCLCVSVCVCVCVQSVRPA